MRQDEVLGIDNDWEAVVDRGAEWKEGERVDGAIIIIIRRRRRDKERKDARCILVRIYTEAEDADPVSH